MSDPTWASLGWTVWRWWILASALGVALGYAMRWPVLLPVIALLTIGISLAIVQSSVLRRSIPNAGWCVLASSVGLVWGAIMGMLLGSVGWGAAAIVLGASLGMIQNLSPIARSRGWLGVAINLPINALIGWMAWRWAGETLISVSALIWSIVIGSAIPVVLFSLLLVITMLPIWALLVIIQVRVLRKRVPNATWWVLASIVGLVCGAIVATKTQLDLRGWFDGIIIVGASLGMMLWLSLITRSKRWPGIIISLPIIALLGSVMYDQALYWTTPLPRWLVSMGGRTIPCQIASRLAAFDFEVKPVEEVQSAQVSLEQARSIADRVLARRFGSYLLWGHAPMLVRMTLPDGRQRLAWYQFELTEDRTGVTGWDVKAATVFVDALTGNPLMLVTDMVFTNPTESGCGVTWYFPLSGRQYGDLSLLEFYLLMLALVVWLGGVIRKARKRARPPSG
jgi:hypothetical protein